MALRLVGTNDSKTALSQDRQALAAHLVREQEMRERLDSLGEVSARAQEATHRESAAQEALDAIAAVEEAALREWSANPTGAMPAPRQHEREEAIEALNRAHAEAMAARKRLSIVQPEIVGAQAELRALVERRRALIGAVLVEEAERVVEQYREALRQVGLHKTALSSIARTLTFVLHQTAAGQDVEHMIAGRRRVMLPIDPRSPAQIEAAERERAELVRRNQPVPVRRSLSGGSSHMLAVVDAISQVERDAIEAAQDETRTNWLALAQRLALDPFATIEPADVEGLRRAGCLDASAPLAPPSGTVLKAPAPFQRFMPRTGVMYVAGNDGLVRDIAAQDVDKLVRAGCTSA